MSGLSKAALLAITQQVTGLNTEVTSLSVAASPTSILPSPSAGNVRIVRLAYVMNLDTISHDVTVYAGSGTEVISPVDTVVAGDLSYVGGFLVKPGDSVDVVFTTAIATTNMVAVICYEEVEDTGIDGGPIAISVATPTTIVSSPTSGLRVLYDQHIGGSLYAQLSTPISVVSNEATSRVVTFAVNGTDIYSTTLVGFGKTGIINIPSVGPSQSITISVDGAPGTPMTVWRGWKDVV